MCDVILAIPSSLLRAILRTYLNLNKNNHLVTSDLLHAFGVHVHIAFEAALSQELLKASHVKIPTIWIEQKILYKWGGGGK